MTSIGFVVASLLAVAAPSVADQEKEATKGAVSETPGTRKTLTPLRVALTVSRYDGEKKVGSLPYTLQVAANDPRGAKVRMGVEVPVPVTTFQGAGSSSSPATSFQYRNVGTNIDCSADSLEDGRFRVILTVEQSSIPSTPEGRSGQARDLPMFRTFNAMVPLVLRDGQTTQYVAATDPVTGESIRIDVALSVIK